MSPQERQEFNQMKATLKAIASVVDVPFIETMKIRIGGSFTTVGVSTKTAASATQSVNESGASSYSVMVPPSGFIEINGVNVPYIT